jgi:hypothetical protein
MTTANVPAPKEVAALLVIGDKILSGRTKDKNIGYIAEYLRGRDSIGPIGGMRRPLCPAAHDLDHVGTQEPVAAPHFPAGFQGRTRSDAATHNDR